MSHYFIENPAIMTDERKLNAEILGLQFNFLTNNGLFSCDKIDEMSRLLIENLPPLKGSFLDLGCGYGVIGIALAKKYNLSLTMSDVNSIALSYAAKNAKLNNVSAITVHSDSFENINGSFDTITLNPPIHAGKDVMYKMYEEAAQHLNPSGSFYVVIQKKHGAESTLRKLNEVFGNRCVAIHKRKGCFVYQCAMASSVSETSNPLYIQIG